MLAHTFIEQLYEGTAADRDQMIRRSYLEHFKRLVNTDASLNQEQSVKLMVMLRSRLMEVKQLEDTPVHRRTREQLQQSSHYDFELALASWINSCHE